VTDARPALAELPRKYRAAENGDVLRDGAKLLAHELMGFEAREKTGADRAE